MKSDFKALYTSAWAFMLACPLLFLIPVLVEFAQHVVEMQTGMYTGEEGAAAAADHPLRMQFGFAKTLALLLPGYWFVRFVMFGNDAVEARRLAWPAIGLWLVLAAISAAQLYWQMFGGSLPQMVGLDGNAAGLASGGLSLFATILGIYFTCWMIAWPLGNARIGPIRSFRIMTGSFWYAVALLLAGVLPLMALHYGLGYAAILWTPHWLDWIIMAFDSVVTGFLALTMTGSMIFAARHAADRKGASLLPDESEPVIISTPSEEAG
ncbi:hypothetical protein ACFCW2_06640 [Qipengyuania sp. DSG2-2]|uniref:hypothetical protein n=1 Tax=Qipengyuania sp. DGS2-2 TaxID=3349631 RepID=UPI0036D2B58C